MLHVRVASGLRLSCYVNNNNNNNNNNNVLSAPSTANRTDEALQCHYDDLKAILKSEVSLKVSFKNTFKSRLFGDGANSFR